MRPADESGWIPESLWQFLYRLSKHRDGPDQWRQQQTAFLQRTTVSLASQAPNPPPELSAHTYHCLKPTSGCGTSSLCEGGYLHLPARHEICTLTDPLEDLLQLGVNKRIIWKSKEGTCQREDGSVPLTAAAAGHIVQHVVSTARTLNTEHLSYFESGSSDFAQCVDYSLCVSLWQERRV